MTEETMTEETMTEETMTLDEAWGLIGEACYCYSNKQARLALMLVREAITEKDRQIKETAMEIINLQQYLKY